jgi:dephospho-CoA kinase
VVVDADRLAREVVEPGTPGLARVVAAFGRQVLRPDGTLDRAALAARVFGAAGSAGSAGTAADRALLESIIHPLVGARAEELIAAAATSDDAERAAGVVVVYDVPLLVENGLAHGYDVVVVVDAAESTRLARLELRGLPEQEARDRMAAQASREERLAVADVVVDNDGSTADLESAVDALWADLLRRATAAAG